MSTGYIVTYFAYWEDYPTEHADAERGVFLRKEAVEQEVARLNKEHEENAILEMNRERAREYHEALRRWERNEILADAGLEPRTSQPQRPELLTELPRPRWGDRKPTYSYEDVKVIE